jgi:hypothetical protein
MGSRSLVHLSLVSLPNRKTAGAESRGVLGIGGKETLALDVIGLSFHDSMPHLSKTLQFLYPRTIFFAYF